MQKDKKEEIAEFLNQLSDDSIDSSGGQMRMSQPFVSGEKSKLEFTDIDKADTFNEKLAFKSKEHNHNVAETPYGGNINKTASVTNTMTSRSMMNTVDINTN